MREEGSDRPSYDPTKENVHSATDPEKCRDMERKYGWKLKRVKPTGDPTLKVDCVFLRQANFF